MPCDQPQPQRPVLIVSDDPAFTQRFLELWKNEPESPPLRTVGSQECVGCQTQDFQFVLLGGLEPDICAQVFEVFRPGLVPVIVIGMERSALGLSERHASKILALPAFPGWRQLLTALGGEITRRSEAQARARRVEMANAALQREALLGQYIIGKRHNLNNALTSVLGNAELLLLNDEKFTSSERKQVDTIRLMALRINETLQRFSVLEKELRASGGYGVLPEEAHFDRERNAVQDRKMTGEFPRTQLARAAGAD